MEEVFEQTTESQEVHRNFVIKDSHEKVNKVEGQTSKIISFVQLF